MNGQKRTVAVINEVTSAERNHVVAEALEELGCKVINVGMKSSEEEHKLNYLHIGFMSALLLNSGRAELVVGGCSTGHGYTMAAMQFPGVYCALVLNPLDAFLAANINAPNCLSLAFNKGYGWGADVNIKFMLERFLQVEPGAGYPASRREAQREGKAQLVRLSGAAHKQMHEIIEAMDPEVVRCALLYPGFLDIIAPDSLKDRQLAEAIMRAVK